MKAWNNSTRPRSSAESKTRSRRDKSCSVSRREACKRRIWVLVGERASSDKRICKRGVTSILRGSEGSLGVRGEALALETLSWDMHASQPAVGEMNGFCGG